LSAIIAAASHNNNTILIDIMVDTATPPVGNHTETRQKIVRQWQKNNLLTALVGAFCSDAAAEKKRQ
jgi:hypothetical protein